MKLYKTVAVCTWTTATRANAVSWQASQTDASKARTAAKTDGRKATSQEFDMPTTKGPLLDWLNTNVKA